MAGTGSSMVYSLLLFTVILSLQEVYRGKLASSELFNILGGFTSSLLFLVLLTVKPEKSRFVVNFQESLGIKPRWGAVLLAELVDLIAAGTFHQVCITTWVSGKAVLKSESKNRRRQGILY